MVKVLIRKPRELDANPTIVDRPRPWQSNPNDIVNRAVGVAFSYRAKNYGLQFALARGYEALIHLSHHLKGAEIDQMIEQVKIRVAGRPFARREAAASSWQHPQQHEPPQ